MIAALIIAAALIGVGALLYIHDRMTRGHRPVEEESSQGNDTEESGCCGMHLTCEKDSLSTSAGTGEIVYYDDEELDIFAGRKADSYSRHEEEQFREIMLTLLPEDIAGWARSLQLRDIEMPANVRDELLLIVSEARYAAQSRRDPSSKSPLN